MAKEVKVSPAAIEALNSNITMLQTGTALATGAGSTTETEIDLAEDLNHFLFIQVVVRWTASGGISGALVAPPALFTSTDGTLVYLNNNPSNNNIQIKKGTSNTKLKITASNANVYYTIHGVCKVSS